MAKRHSKWSLSRDKATGQIIEFLNYWERNRITDSNIELFKPSPFDDTLTYIGYKPCASGIEIHWESSIYRKVVSSIELLDNVLKASDKTNCVVVDMDPLVIKGNFEFIRRGTVLRIIEINK
jgi:hypothetical protein